MPVPAVELSRLSKDKMMDVRGVTISNAPNTRLSTEKMSFDQNSHNTANQSNPRNSVMSTVNSVMNNEDFSDTYKKTVFRLVWNFISCKDLSLKQYRFLLLLSWSMNVCFLIYEVIRIVYFNENINRQDDDYKNKNDQIYIATFIVSTIFTFINCLIIIKLLYRPSPKTALASSAMTMCIQIISVVQCCLYWDEVIHSVLNAVGTFIFLVLELLSAILLYRYWEYAKFYYDDNAATPANLLSDIVTNYQEPDEDFREYSEYYSTVHPNQTQINANSRPNSIDADATSKLHKNNDIEKGDTHSPLQSLQPRS